MWPDLLLVNGRPCHPKSQGSVERSNATMKDSLVAWMHGNNSTRLSLGINKMETFKAMFGQPTRQEMRSSLPQAFLERISSGIMEEELEHL